MTNAELETVAQRVAEMLQQRPIHQDGADSMVMTGSPRQTLNEKLIDEIVHKCGHSLISELSTDEEQFVALNRLRERMMKYWHEQLSTSHQVSAINQDRVQSLGKFIELTQPR